MRILLFTLFWLSAAASAATVYKWVDENGVTHYSDQPHENAQKVELKAPQTYSAPKQAPARKGGAPVNPNSNPEPGPAYQSCTLSEPVNEQVFTNTATVTAGVSVSPAVRAGDTTIVTLDGQRVPGVPAAGGEFTISPVDRGTHSLQVSIQDATGANVCSSPAVTFHVQQPSVLNPDRPVKPH
jgi:Domain of unknown function (DUF4124)